MGIFVETEYGNLYYKNSVYIHYLNVEVWLCLLMLF